VCIGNRDRQGQTDMQTHFGEHPVFGLHHPHTHTLSSTHNVCVTQAGTKVNYCHFRGKLFYALTACGLNHGTVPPYACVFVWARHTLILLSAAIFRLQLFLLLLHMRWCECIPGAPSSPRKF